MTKPVRPERNITISTNFVGYAEPGDPFCFHNRIPPLSFYLKSIYVREDDKLSLWKLIFQLSRTAGFPCGSAGKESTSHAGDLGSIPGLGRSPGEGKGSPLQYSGLEDSMDCIVHEVTKSRTRQSDFDFTFRCPHQGSFQTSPDKGSCDPPTPLRKRSGMGEDSSPGPHLCTSRPSSRRRPLHPQVPAPPRPFLPSSLGRVSREPRRRGPQEQI